MTKKKQRFQTIFILKNIFFQKKIVSLQTIKEDNDARV